MHTIKIYLEYNCFPVWIYDKNGDLVENDLPDELKNDKQIDDSFVNIQKVYDSLFIDNSIEFKYVGFTKKSDRDRFRKMINEAVNLISTKLGDSYLINNNIDIQ